MSDTQNVEARVDDLSKPENKSELEKVLNDQFTEATSPASKPAEGEKPETELETTVETEPEPSAPRSDDEGEPSKDGTQKTGDPANKSDRIKDLLADRNEAKTAAAEAQTEIQTLTKQVQDLTELVQKLAPGESGEGEGTEAPSADDLKGKDLKGLIEQTLNEIEQKKSASESAEKSITEAVQALESNPDTPKAKEYSADIKALMEKHPTISAYMAYVALVGSGKIPSDFAPSNANKTGTGKRSKTGLTRSVNPKDMKQSELEAHLQREEKAGNLQGLI